MKKIEEKMIASSLWSNKIERDCRNQNVFLTIKDNHFNLYHCGGKLFSYYNLSNLSDLSGFKTHIKYASVIPKSKKDYLTESELSDYKLASTFFEDNYQRIKENCSNYSGKEASGVSDIYHRYSYLSDLSDSNNIVVLDIEISFESLNEKNNQDRIDILLYDKGSKTLQFVEAKQFSNKEIWSQITPKVISQIKRYEKQIAERKVEILSKYTEYVKIFNRIFNISLPEPKYIEDKIILLIFDFDNDQKNGRLKKLITKNKEYTDIKIYSIGNIKNIVLSNLWKAKVLR